MTRRASILAYCFVIVLVLLGLQSWSIAIGRVQQRVVSAIENRTGLIVTARERAEIALLPLPRISLSNVAFHQSDGLLKGTALRVRARLRLLPLLVGRLSFDRIELVAPQIDVAIAEPDDRIANWLTPPLSYLERLKVQSRIVMTGGSVFVRAQDAIQTILRDVNLVIEARETNDPIAVSGSLNWRGVATELSVLWPVAGERAKVALAVGSSAMELKFDGIRSGLSEPVIGGKLALSTRALPGLLEWFGERPRLGAALGGLELSADAQITPGQASLSNVVARLDGDRLEGAVKFGDAGGRLSLSGTLAGAELDLGRLLNRLELGRIGLAANAELPLDFDAWTAHDVDLRISVDAARLNGARLDDVATYLLVKKGRFEAGLLRAGAYGGSARGRFLALAAPAGIDVKLQAGLDKVNLVKAAADLPELARLSGTANLQLSLDGAGQTQEQIVASLTGKAAFTARQGELGGFAFADLLRRLERNPKLLLRDWRQGKTAFETATVNFSVANGVASATESQMAGAGYRLGLSGTVSLPWRWFDLSAALSPSNGALQIPFILRGPLDNPAFELDADALPRAGAAATFPIQLLR